MSDTFAKILQTYLFHRDRELRASAKGQFYEWPADRGGLALAWNKIVSIALTTLVDANPTLAVDDRSEEHGYVGLKIDDHQFWVPAPLMSFLPKVADLVELYDAAQKAKLFTGSRICLSGSTVLTGVLKSVGDLDLFEYVSKDAVKFELLEPNPQYRKGELICTAVSYASIDGKFPKGPNRKDLTEIHILGKKMRTFAAKYLEEFNFAKVDMIGMFNGQVGEVTNIIYQHGAGDMDYSLPFPSFPFQEVMTGPMPPGAGAFSLKNFGLYVFWLRDEVDAHRHSIIADLTNRPELSDNGKKMAIKLAKRAMSLSAMLDDNNLAQNFIDALESRESQNYSLVSTSKMLSPLIQGDEGSRALAQASINWITRKMDELNESQPDNLNVDALIAAATSLVNKVDCLCHPNAFEMDVA